MINLEKLMGRSITVVLGASPTLHKCSVVGYFLHSTYGSVYGETKAPKIVYETEAGDIGIADLKDIATNHPRSMRIVGR